MTTAAALRRAVMTLKARYQVDHIEQDYEAATVLERLHDAIEGVTYSLDFTHMQTQVDDKEDER